MAKGAVTGWTKEEMFQARHKYLQNHPEADEEDFERVRCLVRIGKQPDEYDGPQRYCKKYTLTGDGEERSPNCNYHGGWNGNYEAGLAAMDPPQEGEARALKHGMYAEDSNLKDDFSEADERLYELIMAWADRNGWEEGSPEYMLLEDLALSKVREMRAEKYLTEEGEVVEREEFIAELGKLNTYEQAHDLKGELRLQKKTILDMMDKLGLTPKAKSQMDSSETEASAMDQLADVAEEAVSGDHDYDPEQFDSDNSE